MDAKPSLLLRATRPEDAEALADLMNLPGVRRGTLRLPFQSPQEVRKWIEGRQPGDLGLVALLDGKLVGNIGLRRHAGRRAHAAEFGMAVHDDFRRRGIGSMLLDALIDSAERWLGVRRLELTVSFDNEPAIALYRKFSFETEGVLRAYAFRDGAFIDAYTMARLARL
jgi:L-phenylalanine/L-methionine N-acetyltransferase